MGVRRGYEGGTRDYTRTHTNTHMRSRAHTLVCVRKRMLARALCVCVCVCLCVWMCVCARVPRERVDADVCPRASESVRVRVRAGPCARVRVRARVCGSVHADVWASCAFVCVPVRAFCARACACAARARIRVRVRVCFAVPSAYVLRACACVRVWDDCVRAPRRLCGHCGGTAVAGGINGSAGGCRAAARAWFAVRRDRPGCVRVRPQVGRSACAPPRRSGPPELTTHP